MWIGSGPVWLMNLLSEDAVWMVGEHISHEDTNWD